MNWFELEVVLNAIKIILDVTSSIFFFNIKEIFEAKVFLVFLGYASSDLLDLWLYHLVYILNNLCILDKLMLLI